MHVACFMGLVGHMQWFKDHGVDIHQRTANGMTCVLEAKTKYFKLTPHS